MYGRWLYVNSLRLHLLQISQMVPWADGQGASDAMPHTRDGAGCHTGGGLSL